MNKSDRDGKVNSNEKLAEMWHFPQHGKKNVEEDPVDKDFQKVLPFFAAFALPIEKEFSKGKRHASLMSSKIKFNENYKQIHGKTLANCITAQKMAMIMVMLENVIVEDTNDKEVMKIVGKADAGGRRWTTTQERGHHGGQSKRGLERHHESLGRETREHKMHQDKFNSDKECPDYMDYGEALKTTATAKKNKKEELKIEPLHTVDLVIDIPDSDAEEL